MLLNNAATDFLTMTATTSSGEGGYIAVPSTEAENVRLNRWASGSNVVETWIGISVNKTNQIVASDVILEDGEKLLNSTYITPWATTNLTLLV